MKTCVFDIETTSLEAIGAGFVLCAVLQDHETGEQATFRHDKVRGCGFGNEGPLIRAIVDALRGYDVLVGHNINRFDLPFLRTRCMRLGLDWNYRPLVYDTLPAFKRIGYRTVLNGFGKPSAALDIAIDALGMAQEKTKIYPGEWWASVWGDRAKRAAALDAVVDHCQKDVNMNARLFDALLPEDEKATIKRFA